MEYKELSKLFHMDTSNNRYAANIEEYERRKSADSTFCIKVFEGSNELFIAMPREMTVLMESILRTERKSSSMMKSIPPVARAALIRGLVLDEVVSTNAIENINSTRKQIEEALESQRDVDVEFKRFKELALLYLGLEDDTLNIPKEPKDIREIYDVIMKGELEDAKRPDGDLFRKDGVDITAGGIKVVHSGVEPESKITEGLQSMIALTGRDDIPSVIRSIATHYIFEYVHPFYDGNGRTGRYLLALFLGESLSTPTVLSLSRAISENKNSYYSAFASVENPLNHGEMTHFVYAMLELIRIAQSGTIARIQNSIDRFNSVREKCSTFFKEKELSEKEEQIVFVLAQCDLFGMLESMLWEELADEVRLSKQMTRKHAKELERKNIVTTSSKRPLKFTLTHEAKEELGIIEG